VTPTTKQRAKRLLAQGLAQTGWWDLALRRWARRDHTIVLTYHRVLEKWEPTLDYSQPGMVVMVPTFERQLAFLQRHFEIVPLDALLDDGEARRSPRRPRCVITFDDGWRDNYDLAFPVLRKREIPATVFLTTDFIGSDRTFWHTELIYLLLHGDVRPLLRDDRILAAYPETVRVSLTRYAAQPEPLCADGVDTVIETVKTACDEEVIRELIETLTPAVGLRRPFFPGRRFFLDWDQIREMAHNGFDIGSHGCTHRILTRLSMVDADEELCRSKAEIGRRVGGEIRHFAFPNEDTNDALLQHAAEAGYRTACVGGVGEARPEWGIRALRRVGLHEGASVAGLTHEDALLGLCFLRAPANRT
jgi:peptidoglycan/xylan/chitin deacetylase (PgdA/CDA1 family)